MKRKILCFVLSLILTSASGIYCCAASDDADLLSRAIEAAASGESYTVMAALASVLMNRVSSECYPDSLAAVISDAGIDISSAEPTPQARRAARDAIGGFDPTSGAIGYSVGRIPNCRMLLFVDGWSFY